MNAGEAQALARITVASDVHRLSDRYAVQFTLREGRLCVEWLPHLPRGVKGQLLLRYRRARDQFLRMLSQHAGLRCCVVEVQP